MMEQMDADLKQDMQLISDLQKRQANRFQGYFSNLNTKNQDAATRIQRIVRGFIQQKFNFASLEQQSAVKIQTLIQGFLCRQQLHVKSNNLPESATKQDLRSFNNDLLVITNEFRQLLDSSRNKHPDHNILWPQHGPDPVFPMKQRDKDPDHIILWPRHGPDPAEQPSIQRCFAILSSSQADAKLPTHDYPTLPLCVGPSCSAEYI
jgi:hypothetical protein